MSSADFGMETKDSIIYMTKQELELLIKKGKESEEELFTLEGISLKDRTIYIKPVRGNYK
jgi:hypothetical protein